MLREETMLQVETALLGFPRVGADRELKRALEAHWQGRTTGSELRRVARDLRRRHVEGAHAADVDVIPSNDFSLYDHVLDTAVMLGAIPERFRDSGLNGDELYFAMARGTREVRPLEMTKWLDTNYHYLVPELSADTAFALRADKPLEEFADALSWGVRTRPVILGPVSFLLLAKSAGGAAARLALLDRILPLYEELLIQLVRAGAGEIQIDEPCLVQDRVESDLALLDGAWRRLAAAAPDLELSLATYFEGLGEWTTRVLQLPAAEFHLDLVRAPQQLAPALGALPDGARLSLGVVDGRNVWASDLDAVLTLIEPAIEQLGAERVRLAPSCSLMHVPYRASREERLDPEVRSWLAFGEEKLLELQTLKAAQAAGGDERRDLLAANRRILASRRGSARVHDPSVSRRLRAVRPNDMERRSVYAERAPRQADLLGLPELPTTTIGSFPQTPEIRRMRSSLRRGDTSPQEYDDFLKGEIRTVIERQEELGFDVLVHGEAERNDMVEHFAEHLAGFVMSSFGWVQSYGSRCVKPPILYGDVARPEPMTVSWWEYAQSCSTRPVKGMLTGPVTILQWSFVRDDQPREETCRQIALAIRDEVLDLERAGARAIQMDEAALREGLPLRGSDQDAYLRWAVDCFRLASNGIADETQLHSHMCYSEFNDMIEHIARMDADVLLIEASRSQMELLNAFRDFRYPNAIGPGVYDIH
ncbi:MAG: 5-methyltetrahydropteroyltriglutamate--homocysteine S-methyltransferase, partial [Candidatus Dormibacteria bacterium]